MRRIHPVWGLNLLLALATALVTAVVVLPRDDALADASLPWWALAVLVLAAERWPVHLAFRRSAHSFSMTDIPLVLGLVFVEPSGMLAAVALGTAVAMALRRVVVIKLVFNVLQFVFCAALAILVVRLTAGLDGASFDPRAWLAVTIAVQLSALAGMGLICAAIVRSDGTITREQLLQMLGRDAIVTLTNTSLALLLAVLVIEAPEAVPIVVVPVAVVYAAYRTLAGEREQREKLQFLYETNRTFIEEPELGQAIGSLLERAAEAFRVEQGEVVLFSTEEAADPVRVTVLGVGGVHEMLPVTEPGADALLAIVAAAERPVAFAARLPSAGRPYLDARGLERGVVAVLRGEERAIGFLVLADRTGIDGDFSAADVALVETLAANASAVLQYDRLEQTVAELRLLQERLHHQAFHDGLTGLANRALFHQEVHDRLEGPEETEVGVLFFDLDDFKAVNDTFGHALGDELLSAAADRLRMCLTTSPDAVVARLGGDEFAVLLTAERAAIEQRTATAAEAILEAFRDPVAAGGRQFTLSLSLGAATSRHSGGRAPDLLRDADVAMYEAKGAGKGRWRIFDPAMRDALLERHALRAELEHAITEGELIVHFQPIVDVRSGQAAAVEALVRWEHPVRGRIAPLTFIPIAEESGLIVALGRFVLREACRRAAGWQAAGVDGGPLAVHVNLSARELEHPDIVASVSGALADSGVAPQQLVLELTESLLVQDAKRGARTLTALRELGVRLALDDFGTGFSSLSYLQTLPLDQLKIAREFVDGLGENRDDHTFVRLILELAQSIGLQVVAEGVESTLQLDELRALGCDYVQGYLLGRPAPAVEAFAALPRAGAA